MRFLFLLWYCLVKHFNNIIQFLLKISLIWWDKVICNFKYIFINETSFIKNNCNSYGQMSKSFTGWGKTSQSPKGREWGKKIFLIMRGKAGWDKTKPCRAGVKTPSFGPAPPIAIPSGDVVNGGGKMVGPHFHHSTCYMASCIKICEFFVSLTLL